MDIKEINNEILNDTDITTLESNTLDEDTIESTCLYKLVICFTGFDAEELSEYEYKIISMGGRYSPHLTNEVTHLISRHTTSDKYKVAVQLNIPIVREDWIKECYNRRFEKGFNGKRIAPKYLLPPFVDVQICVTGISGDDRELVEDYTRKNGGQYSADLTHQCTHLIVEKPEGRKYQFAKEWGLYLVHQQWFNDCIKRQARIDEKDYLLEKDDYTTSDGTVDINESNEEEQFKKILDEDKSSPENHIYNYLERCIIYIGCDFPPDLLQLLKKSILFGGGIRYSEFNSKVTHFVIKDKYNINKSDKNTLKSVDNECIVVNYRWLFKCYLEKKLYSTENYRIETPENRILSLNSQIILNDDEDQPQNNGKIKIRNNNMSLNYDVNHMYEDLYNENNKKNDGFIEDNNKNSHLNQINKINKIKGVESKVIQPVSKLFEGLSFISKGFRLDHERKIEEIVLKYSGQYFHSEIAIKNNYYQILPFSNALNIIVSQKAIIVTEHWLERCVFDNVLYNPDDNPIFLPCTLEIPIEEFNGVLIGVTGFSGLDRAHIAKLVSKLGGIFSETLSKKHNILICNPKAGKGSLKYEKALEWNIPILKVEWIYDCFRRERKLPYENYLIGDNNSNNENEDQLVNDNELLNSLSFAILNNDKEMKEEPEEIQNFPDNKEENPLVKNDEKKESQENELKENEELESAKEKNPELLKGVVISVSQRLSHRKNELWELATKMGAEYIVKYNDTCTHYIHSSNRVKEPFKDFKSAYSKKKYIVSPVWLEKCYELQQHVPESDYPHTYNPNKQLVLKTKENNQAGMNIKSDALIKELVSESSTGNELTRNHSNANLNSFFENYVTTSKPSIDKQSSNNNDPNQKENSMNLDTNNNITDNNNNDNDNNNNNNNNTEEVDGEKAEGYVSAMDNIIKMTSMRRRPRSLRRETSNDKGKTDNETNKIENDKKLSINSSKRKFDEENDEGFVKIDDPEARMEKLKLLDKVNQNKKRNRTSNKNSSSVHDNNNNININDIMSLEDENDDDNNNNPNENDLNNNNNNNSHNTTSDIIKMTLDNNNNNNNGDNNNGDNNKDLMKIDERKEEDSPESLINIEKSFLINNDKVRIKTESTIKKTTEVYDDSFIINRNNLRGRRGNTMCFMFSILKNELRAVYAKKIKAFGGKVIEKDYWDESCTHLIIKEPNRGEKYLAAIASGVWILKPEYMEECINQGRFVNEEDYEWGRSSSDNLIAKAAPRWRLKLENYMKQSVERTRGSFEGWDILLMVDAKKRDGFTRLLKAGKGKVTILKNSLRNIKNKNYTHFFIDGTTRNRIKDLSSLAYLKEKNILCYDAQYIAEYLTSSNPQSSRFEIKFNK